MGELISFEELWDEHIHDEAFLRDYHGEHAASLLKQYGELPPALQAEFCSGLESGKRPGVRAGRSTPPHLSSDP